MKTKNGIGESRNEKERLKEKLEAFEGSPLTADEEKLKKRCISDLLAHSYDMLEAEVVAVEAVLGKRKMDSFAVSIERKK